MINVSFTRWPSKNGHQKDTYSKEIGLHVLKILLPFLSSTTNIIGGTYMRSSLRQWIKDTRTISKSCEKNDYRSTIAGLCTTSKRIFIYFQKIRFVNWKCNLWNFVRPMIQKKLIRFFGKVQHKWQLLGLKPKYPP